MNTAISEIKNIAGQHSLEVSNGERFEFGKNWGRFLELLNEERITKAEESLCEMLGVTDLSGKTFLDIGSGSGLFSLAARRLGASVHSFDFDTDSYECTKELRRLYFEGDTDWKVEQGSAIDRSFIESLGKFDYVYSWGVLHHTGDMRTGLENAARAVDTDGSLFIAIYNDTGSQAKRWRWIKKTYCRLPRFLKAPYAVLAILPDELKTLVGYLSTGDVPGYFRFWKEYTNARGMNRWHDIIDWVGGYPYEFASPDLIFDFYKSRGFDLIGLKCGGVGLGCNEFVFKKVR